MRRLFTVASLAVIGMLTSSCSEEPVKNSSPEDTRVGAWETVLDNSFTDYTTFESKWNYLYPWGSDHNGSARMYGSTTDHNHIYITTG